MSLISGAHDGRRVVWDVAVVGVSLSGDPSLGNIRTTSVFSEPVKALVDTGATSTSISPQAARRLGLTSIGKRDVMTANGLRRARVYDFQIALIGVDAGAAPFYVLPKAVSGTELNPDMFAFDILLGMDVISQGDLIIRRDGTFSFEF